MKKSYSNHKFHADYTPDGTLSMSLTPCNDAENRISPSPKTSKKKNANNNQSILVDKGLRNKAVSVLGKVSTRLFEDASLELFLAIIVAKFSVDPYTDDGEEMCKKIFTAALLRAEKFCETPGDFDKYVIDSLDYMCKCA